MEDREYYIDNFDVAVIGAGHAGIEAALAAARLGAKTVLFTIVLDAIGNMPCNPSIGGTAKGHLVREIDALGGEMAKAADEVCLQSRMLNKGKGPAVYSLRIQADRKKYQQTMKARLEKTENLEVKQAEIVEIKTENGAVTGVVTRLGAVYGAKAVIIASGTYLEGRVHIGKTNYMSGPDGLAPALGLSDCLRSLGIELKRFKTGTPPRVHRKSIDFSALEIQIGDEPIVPMSFETEEPLINKEVCHIAYTNKETHKIILDNLDRSPLYGGLIKGTGPRYCPSIEDKVVRFSDKERHQIFIEPTGENTDEMYLQGISSSLPEDVQLKFVRSIKGLEKVEMMRVAYAIEYDCCDPLQLNPTLEFKKIKGLYGAGQFNGSSGYEEAAAQGLLAGINAARLVSGKEQIVLERSGSYIGTLIDDLVTKGVEDPYRMMTSRSEYRLLLRQDNADERLTPLGYEIGLISEERYNRFLEKRELIKKELHRTETTFIPPSEELNKLIVSRETSPISTGMRLSELIKRPQLDYKMLAPFDKTRPVLPDAVQEEVEITLKYEGYISRQQAIIDEIKRLDGKKLSPDTDYKKIRGLRLEAQEKLNKVKPLSVGQASRISGVNPADISVLLIYLEQTGK